MRSATAPTTTTIDSHNFSTSRDQPIHILYATQGGTAKFYAHELQRTLQDELHLGHIPVMITCQCCRDAAKNLLEQKPFGLFIFVVATTGVGEPPDHAREF
jgi:sulfite reductase alpha subunit-like flavoprotein